jgi:hypothetical protein
MAILQAYEEEELTLLNVAKFCFVFVSILVHKGICVLQLVKLMPYLFLFQSDGAICARKIYGGLPHVRQRSINFKLKIFMSSFCYFRLQQMHHGGVIREHIRKSDVSKLNLIVRERK